MSGLFTGIHEIAIAVNDIDAAARSYAAALDAELDPVTSHVEEGIGIRQTGVWVGDFRIALVTDATGEGPVAKFLESRGEGPYELCLRTRDLTAAVTHLAEVGWRVINDEPRILRDYRWRDEVYSEVRVVFLHPASTHGLLIELQEWVR